MLAKLKKPILLSIFLTSTIIFPWLVMGPLGDVFAGPRSRLAAFVLLASGGAVILKLAFPHRSWGELACLAALVDGVVHQIATFLPEISSYPLSLGWSETSRFYYASLFFSPQLYGFSVPPSILHPTRYLMQAVPFIFPEAPLWLHRLWQVILWLVTTSAAVGILARRILRPQPAIRRWLFAAFAFLFLFQGPVYYHLLVMVIVVLWGVDIHRPWRSLLVVIIASIWAGLSRVNWLPVPGLLATTLYLLEIPRPSPRNVQSVSDYLLPPAAWVLLGTSAGWLTQTAYKQLSGNPPEYFGASFTSDLLWYRLLPNVTYPEGILLSALLASLPLLVVVAIRLILLRDGLRALGLAAILGVLFAGGIIVSVKIGGGSNLHNLDAFLVLLLVVGSHIFANSIGGNRLLRGILTFLVLLPPLVLTLTSGGRWNPPNVATAQSVIATLRSEVESVAKQGGQILFIRERQLLMFGDLPGVKLAPDYEVVFLMEMVMGNNRAYLDHFYDDLRNQRFALIVVDPQNTQHQGRMRAFGEENDVWADRVAIPLMCTYEPKLELPDVNLVVLAPRPTINCP